ncbi:energy transducer TonB [Roseomonas xinghualingensis]|uniref:energy transducer TonB n=1 Tax=Roseomonas xinghualingensis TaxID=2986475 RepID=UPI0021F0F56D|nr:energy transducer TonB [Roseomonas sp. SXEYE001]MCV4207867.1 energy transducer TonB [Roseomonas sp. SXEYE001]
MSAPGSPAPPDLAPREATPWEYAPAAARAWRRLPRRGRRRTWAWWAAAALHGAGLAAMFLVLNREPLEEPLIVEGMLVVWEGAPGAGDGAPELSPEPQPPAVQEAPIRETPPPVAEATPAPARLPVPPAPPAPPPPQAAAQPDPPAPPSPDRATSPPRTQAAEAEPIPLPPPPAPPAPSRPIPSPSGAPSSTVERARVAEAPPAPGAVRLGAGTIGSPGESRSVGAPKPGCQDIIGYPDSERQRGVTGSVAMRLRISDDGRVVEARLVERSGSFALDEAAQRGIRRCRFEPALRDGVPVWGSRDYRVVFRLE